MKLVLDTGVIVEYIISNSPLRPVLTKLFSSALRGANELYLSTVTLAETFYVARRIYEWAGVEQPEEAARDFLFFLEKHKALSLVQPNTETAVEAGKVKAFYRVSLADSFVLATAKIFNAKALFRKVEKEIEPYMKALKKEYGLTTVKEIISRI